MDDQILRDFEAAAARRGGATLESELIYLRWQQWRMFAGTEKAVPVFAEANAPAHDMRNKPFQCLGYEIKAVKPRDDKPYEAHVEITAEFLSIFEERWLNSALEWSVEQIAEDFSLVDYVTYPAVRVKVERILNLINERRLAAGLPLVPRNALSQQKPAVSLKAH
jgi:hypothetical protein